MTVSAGLRAIGSLSVVVILVAAIIGLAALRLLIEGSPTGSIVLRSLIVSGVGLAVMVVFNVWHTGRLKQYCVLLGILAERASPLRFRTC